MWWFVLALLSGFGAAVLAILVKLYFKDFNPFFITFLFSIIAAILLLIADILTKKINCSLLLSLTMKDWMLLSIGGCLNALAFSSYIGALKYGKPAGVVAIDRLGVVYVVIFSVIFLQESFSIKAFIGALTMVIGAALLSV